MKNKIFFCLTSILLIFSVFSCKKNQKPTWDPETGHVAILFGYGFNDEEFLQPTLEMLNEKFSLEENSGLIEPLVFPQDFMFAGSGRISLLADYIQEKNCKALITLGAPEFTFRTLAKIKDENPEIFIISLFSQDDVQSTEGDSDIVIDFAEPEKNEDEAADLLSENSIPHMDKIPYILEKTIESVAYTNVFQDKQIKEVLPTLYGSEWQVASYVNSTTGIKIMNHFVLKYVEKPTVEKRKRIKPSK